VEQQVKSQPATTQVLNHKHVINKDVKKELAKQQRIFEQLELKISETKEQKKQREISLGLPEIYSDPKKFAETERSYHKLTEELDKLNKQYEEVFEQIVTLERNLTS